MRLRLFFVISMIFFTLHAPLAMAAVSEAQVASIKAGIQNLLDYNKQSNEAFGDIKIEYEGDLLAEPQEDFVALTSPKIILKSTHKDNQNTVDFGQILIKATPDTTDTTEGFWKTVITFPSTLVVKDGANPDLSIHIGSQNMTATFRESLGYFTQIDWNFMNITAQEGGKDLGLNIDTVKAVTDFKDVGDGDVSGPFNVSMEGFKIGNVDSVLRIGNLGLTSNIEKWKLMPLSHYRALFEKHKAGFEALDRKTDDPEQLAKQNKALMDMIFAIYTGSVDGISLGLSVNDVSVDTYGDSEATEGETAEKPLAEAEKFTLTNANFDIKSSGLKSDSGLFYYGLGYSGLSISPPDPQYDGILPTDVRLGFQTEKLPIQSLYAVLKNTLESALANPDMAGVASIGLMIKLPALLSQAGTELTVQDNFVRGGLYETKIDGNVKADITALSSFTAKFKGVFEGLDELIARLKMDEKIEDSYAPEEYADIAASLETIKGYGTPRVGGAGRSAYDFDIELDPTGKILLNGKETALFPGTPDIAPAPSLPPQPATEPTQVTP